MDVVMEKRNELMQRLFPGGVPRIWCPMLTHYNPDGGIDGFRMRAMLRSLYPHVGGLVAAGETGDGYRLTRKQCDSVLNICLEDSKALGMRVLFAVLEDEAQDAFGCIYYHLAALERKFKKGDHIENLIAAGLCGYLVYLPVGDDMTDEELVDDLTPIMELGVPIALVNDPAVTHNQLSPKSICEFAHKYPHFFCYQDKSGRDEFVLSQYDDDTLYTLRGFEYDYSSWFDRYDGFMVPSANCFASAIARIWAEREDGEPGSADDISLRITNAVRGLVELGERMEGDVLQNAARLGDHFRAYGKDSWDVDPSLTFGGEEIPYKLIEAAGDIINDNGLSNENGYMV
ncbi:MAG: hypothetical protein E7334_03365 [Clostridiales bacterium]|nr:hypothetical protein [Clostridiales bacterium]